MQSKQGSSSLSVYSLIYRSGNRREIILVSHNLDTAPPTNIARSTRKSVHGTDWDPHPLAQQRKKRGERQGEKKECILTRGRARFHNRRPLSLTGAPLTCRGGADKAPKLGAEDEDPGGAGVVTGTTACAQGEAISAPGKAAVPRRSQAPG